MTLDPDLFAQKNVLPFYLIKMGLSLFLKGLKPFFHLQTIYSHPIAGITIIILTTVVLLVHINGGLH